MMIFPKNAPAREKIRKSLRGPEYISVIFSLCLFRLSFVVST